MVEYRNLSASSNQQVQKYISLATTQKKKKDLLDYYDNLHRSLKLIIVSSTSTRRRKKKCCIEFAQKIYTKFISSRLALHKKNRFILYFPPYHTG